MGVIRDLPPMARWSGAASALPLVALMALAVLLAVIAGACGSGDTEVKAAVVAQGSASEGAQLYEQECARCHGDSGDRIPISPLFSKPFLDGRGDATLLAVVADGKLTMPGYSTTRDGPFDDDEIRSVVSYLNARAGRASTTLLAAEGKKLYEELCLSCHGAAGDRIPIAPLGAKGYLDSRSDAELQRVIVEGRGEMAGLGPGYNARDATAILAYLRYRVQALVASSVSEGRDLYIGSCLACHGTSGNRVPEVALASASFLGGLGDGRIISAVHDGTETGPAFGAANGGSFNVSDTAAVLMYLKSWAGLNATVALSVGGPAASGETLYLANCSACHGETGDRVLGVALMSAGFLERETREVVTRAVQVGEHQAMPASGVEAGGVLSEQQVASIVNYLFVASGAEAGGGAASGESPGAPAGGGADEPVFDGLTAREYFDASCSACHQTTQFGDNLTESDDFYFEKLATGTMSSFAGGLTDDQVDALVAFMRNPDGTQPPSSDPGPESPPGKPAELLYGEGLYEQACAACHGADGRRIKAALVGSRDWLASLSPEGLLNRIGQGDPSRGMPSYGESYGGWLTQQQIQSLAEYLGSIAQ